MLEESLPGLVLSFAEWVCVFGAVLTARAFGSPKLGSARTATSGPAGTWRFHAQQIASCAQVSEQASFHQILAMFIHQRFKGNEIKLSIRRDQQMARIAGKRTDWTHDFLIDSTRHLLHVARFRITQRSAQSVNGSIDGFCVTYIHGSDFIPGDDVSCIPRLTKISGALIGLFRIVRPVDSILNQCSVGWYGSLNCL